MKGMRILLRLPACILLVGIFAFTATDSNAVTLYGRVTAIDEGDLFTMINLNRPVKIRLAGIDAPEIGQSYSDLAKQHLSDLILNKVVFVEYSGMAQNNQIVGKVYVKDLDIGAQMIRDGVAWFDGEHAVGLNQIEKETYAATQQAARNDHLGIWQDESPVAPWDFKRTLATRQSLNPNKKAPAHESVGLTSNDLLSATGGAAKFLSSSDETYSTWKTLSPKGFDFSVNVPGSAVERGVVIPTSNGTAADINVAVGADGKTTYTVLWSKGPSDGVDDTKVTDDAVQGFTMMLNASLAKQGIKFTPQREKSLRVGAFNGNQYKLVGSDVSGLVRVFSRHNVSERQVYMLAVINGQETDKPVGEFLNSLRLAKK